MVGISEGTSMWAAGLMFVRKDAAQGLMGSSDATSLLLVTPERGVASTTLRERLGDISGTDAMLKSTMADNDQQLFARAFGGPLRLMVGISLLVGSASLVIAALAAVLPIRQIAGLDPAAVFRG